MKSPHWSSLNTGRFILKGHAKCMLQVFLWSPVFDCFTVINSDAVMYYCIRFTLFLMILV